MSITDRMSGFASKGSGISGMMSGSKPKPEMEHEGGVPEHLKAMHAEMGGKHGHIHHHEGGVTTHHIGEDGNVQGPHEHDNMEEAADHLKKSMGEEAEDGNSHENEDSDLM